MTSLVTSQVPHPRTVHLGVDLSDAGAHPAAWRTIGSQAQRVFDAERLAGLVATAQRGVLDFVAFDDSFTLQASRNTTLRGRLDAALVSARLAPRSAGIGLVATVDTTHTEPFHVSKAIQTIDHVSGGRAAWQVAWSTSPQATAAFGRRVAPTGDGTAAAVAEADEAVDVVRKLWDSWEDDAEIRDAATSRFIDREKVHYIDHDGVHFAVKGPSITPRSPQGQPPVVVRLGVPGDAASPGVVGAPATNGDRGTAGISSAVVELAGRHADVVRVRAVSRDVAYALRAQVRAAALEAGRDPDSVRVLVDAYVVIGQDRASAQARLDLLTELEGVSWDTDSLTHVGTARDLVETVEEWSTAGAADGFTFRPSSLQTDLDALVDDVVPDLQRAGLFRTEYPGATLRDTLGLPRPASRYAAIA